MRSATVPPTGATRNTGNWLANPTDPNSNGEPVIRYTSHDCATVCIHVPTSEINWPQKKSWKFRCFSARMPALQRPGFKFLDGDEALAGSGAEIDRSGTSIGC